MKKIPLSLLFVLLATVGMSQKVGVGTNSPQKLLAVNGSVLVDQGNTNYGTLDSAALRFGTTTGVGISSSRVPGSANVHGLDLWTTGLRRLIITNTGYVGINNTSPTYRLDVGGSIHATNLYGDGDISAGSNIYAGNSATVNDYLGVGASHTSNYRLYVNGNALINTNLGVNGNARVDGSTNLNGTLSVDGKVTNAGKAIMLSNSGTTLRSGFSKGAFGIALAAGGTTTIEFCIPKFTGDEDNVRVMTSQFIAGSGSVNVGCFIFTPVGTSTSSAACSGGSSATIRITNPCSVTANSGTNAVLHLFSVVTD